MRFKLSALALTAVFVSSLAAFIGVVNAEGEGQIEGGNIYRVRNVTKGGDFTDPANADACDIVQYKVRIHNPGPGALSEVNVKATLPAGAATSHTSTVTVSAQNADPASTSDTAVVNLSSSQSISYISGSTELLNPSGGVISGLPDGITQGGVNIGNVGVSIDQLRFVQFKAKINCPEQPPCTDNPETPGDECNPKPPCEDNSQTPEDECNPKPPVTPPTTPEQPGQPQPPVSGASTPESLPDTGPGDVAAVFVIFSVAASAAYKVGTNRMFEF